MPGLRPQPGMENVTFLWTAAVFSAKAHPRQGFVGKWFIKKVCPGNYSILSVNRHAPWGLVDAG